jgi:hypothetical protein
MLLTGCLNVLLVICRSAVLAGAAFPFSRADILSCYEELMAMRAKVQAEKSARAHRARQNAAAKR